MAIPCLSARLHPALGYLLVLFGALASFLVVFLILRLLLLWQNTVLLGDASFHEVLRSFVSGARFDLRMASYATLPLVLRPIWSGPRYGRFCLFWMSLFAGIYLFLGVAELPFYHEVQQRLNILAVQYLREDATTVAGMIWSGFPVPLYLGAWAILFFILYRMLGRTLALAPGRLSAVLAIPLACVLFLGEVAIARGTFRSGPPLRWGDAYFSGNMFLNHLGLNGGYTLAKAVMDDTGNAAPWKSNLDPDRALQMTRDLVLTRSDTLVDPGKTALLRANSAPPVTGATNVVIVLMESFSGQFTGALGNDLGVTPAFDRLADQGMLMTHAFSNGTHTHQGIFATLSCFPNLPGHEYLMQQSEGQHQFSGLSAILPDYQSIFIYNGDFNWDNQFGFFRNQGMEAFIGRYDFRNPKYVDEVWGVSDEDTFNRAESELDRLAAKGSFFAVLQTLSNHVPYNIPVHDGFEPVTGQGELSERLTAMKYSDWALGQFFDHVRDEPWFGDTLFVILGDHAFGIDKQLTEVNLLRFHIPMLYLGPGIEQMRRDAVTTQVDVIPSLLGLMGQDKPHQCWGRNVFDAEPGDPGIAVIKPSGGEQTVAIVKGRQVLTFDRERGSHLYDLALYPEASVTPLVDAGLAAELQQQLDAYIATAMKSLNENTTYARR